MLLFPVGDLPQLSKGKGNKIISITSAAAAAGEDGLAHLFVIPADASVTLHFGKRKLVMRPEELQKFRAERGRRGTALPRGMQKKIERVEIVIPEKKA